jgi:hypothetical protein
MKTNLKKSSRKLNLDRETLAPLHAEQLSDVNGGITPSVFIASAVSGSVVSYFACR